MWTVYVLKECKGPYYKVGYSRRLWCRVLGLQTGNPRRLEIVAEFKFHNKNACKIAEKAIHKNYKHVQGIGEWFKFQEKEYREMTDWLDRMEAEDQMVGAIHGKN